MIPKQHETDCIEKCRHISLMNFQFKTITKIIWYMFSILPPKIISEHERGFIRGYHIYECIRITLEAVNMLDKKSFRGSMNLDIDIRNIFDTLDW